MRLHCAPFIESFLEMGRLFYGTACGEIPVSVPNDNQEKGTKRDLENLLLIVGAELISNELLRAFHFPPMLRSAYKFLGNVSKGEGRIRGI